MNESFECESLVECENVEDQLKRMRMNFECKLPRVRKYKTLEKNKQELQAWKLVRAQKCKVPTLNWEEWETTSNVSLTTSQKLNASVITKVLIAIITTKMPLPLVRCEWTQCWKLLWW